MGSCEIKMKHTFWEGLANVKRDDDLVDLIRTGAWGIF